MKRARRFPQRLVRWTSLCVCFALVLSCLVVPFASVTGEGRGSRGSSPTVREGVDTSRSAQQGNGQERRVTPPTPQPGPPRAGLPNLDDLRRAADDSRLHGPREVHAPPPVPSTQRRWKLGRESAAATVTTTRIEVKAHHARGNRGTSPTTREGLVSGMALPEPQGPDGFAMARIDPHNRTGTGGADLLSNNFNWSLGLVGLKGRGGLDLGLSLSYNSLVWTRSGNYIKYDLDDSTVAPGFRLDFPVIEGPNPYWNDQAHTNFYLMVTPFGARVELRYVGIVNTYDTYESQDSAHLQLQVIDSTHILVRPTDGTRMSFTLTNGMWRCNEIKDRNGNYLTITHNGAGDLSSVIDTLNRTITVTYDGNGNIQTIDQTWNGQTPPHHWATFGWGQANIGNNFSGLINSGPNNTSISVLTQVGLPDGSYYTFEYANGYGQVTTIRYFGGDARPLRYTTIAYSTSGSDPIPRVSEQHEWADWWNGMNNVPSEVVTYYTHDGDGACRMTLPDGTVDKEYYGNTWQSGLTTETKNYATATDANNDSPTNHTWKKDTITQWTQDNLSVSYLTNPRVIQTDIWDIEGNHRKTTISYGPYVLWSLPYLVQEYDQSGNVLRNTYTDYWTDPNQSLDQQYLQQRIIGLVKSVHVSDSSGWQSKTAYGYDTTSVNPQAASATQHDGTNYPASFNVRGNVTAVSRYDVTDITNDSKAHTSHVTYDAAGSVLTGSDALNHQTTIEYSDSFAYAYPTKVKDPDWDPTSAPNNYSTAQYNFDTGAVTRTDGPPPAGQTQGASQTMTYDSAGRLSRTDNLINGAYVRWDYGSWTVTKSATIQDGAGESHTVTILNGFGQAEATGGDNPGSAGGNWGKFTIYDIMDRPSQFTNPTEINGGWVPSGDDAAGWLFSTPIIYDWKGRPRFTYNLDGTYKEASYTGCGCAGGEVVTLTDEGTLVNGVQQYRRQKIYSDPIGRQWKTEVLNWDGSVYSTGVSVYNGRDQVSRIKQYSGPAPSDASSTNANASCPSGTCQESAMTFDGYGRLQTKHVPEQQVDPNNNASTDHTSYTYKDDDAINSVTDARGASATYGYNNRHLVTAITYNPPAGITPTANVTFGYDPAGNRTSMTDGLGTVNYSYNQLSRLSSETRYFSSLWNSPTGGNYGISYQYNLGGELTSITDPFGAQIGYVRDNTGRTTNVTGSGFANVSSYVSNIQYRAWGAVKSAAYGNNSSRTTQYNARLQPTQFRLRDNTYNTSLISENYAYFGDGRLSSVTDLDDTAGTNPPATLRFLTRSYGYDQAGRVMQGYSPNTAPFRQSYGYDEFDNMTSRAGSYYWQPYQTDTASYVNNRRNGWSYDADGHISYTPPSTNDGARNLWYDAAGRLISNTNVSGSTTTNYIPRYDGDGRLAYEWAQTTVNGSSAPATTSYIVRSTVLGGEILTRLAQNGNKSITFVPAEGLLFATQGIDYQGSPYVGWTQRNPLGITETGKGVYDPLGNYIPFQQHDDPRPPVGSYNSSSMSGIAASLGNTSDYGGMGCLMDGIPTSCSRLLQAIRSGLGDKLLVSGTSRADLLKLGIVITEGPLENDTRLWGIWAVIPGSQQGNEQNPQNPAQQKTTEGLNPVEGEKRWNDCMNKYLPGDFPGGRNKPTGQAVGAANRASGGSTNDTALILGIIAKESGFSPTPTQDHGPMQLTSWISNYAKNHNLDIVVPGSYDPFPRVGKNRDRTFTGNYDANVQTGENWIGYERNSLKMSDWQIANGWGPGPTADIRKAYADDAISLRDRYAPFVNCLKTGQ